ncbi:MAG: hypothetical protein HDQ96_10560 [Lachnospiraceae bacterium]|nr:hypothetical protein [Lachnospiraceae bacterium]
MLKQIKDLCIFMICGQTLLYFQSGKKYEKICKMILELLVLAGIIGMILNFLQSLGFQKGEMAAAGGAVAGMQRSMEQALSKQLGEVGEEEDFLSGNVFENLVEKYTSEEIKTRYNYFAQQYGMEIQRVEQNGEKLRVFLKEVDIGTDIGEEGGEKREIEEETADADNSAKIAEIDQIEIGEIILNESEKSGTKAEGEGKNIRGTENKKKNLEVFRRQLALIFAMEEEKLEVILID